MIVRGRHRRHRTKRGASSSALLMASVLLIAPAVGLLVADSVVPSGRVDSGGVSLEAPPESTEPPVQSPTEPVEPGRILIEAIGVSANVEAVGLAADGSLALPADVANVGWYVGSSQPGEMGPTVMVGHVDSVDGPAVFARLSRLQVGDVVTVESGAGTVVSFTVTTVSRHSKQSFPTQAVYGATPDAELRLITCGGQYDRVTGYAENVVVLARAATESTLRG